MRAEQGRNVLQLVVCREPVAQREPALGGVEVTLVGGGEGAHLWLDMDKGYGFSILCHFQGCVNGSLASSSPFQFAHSFHDPQIIRPRLGREIAFHRASNGGANRSVGTGDQPAMGLRVAVRE